MAKDEYISNTYVRARKRSAITVRRGKAYDDGGNGVIYFFIRYRCSKANMCEIQIRKEIDALSPSLQPRQ